MAHRSHGPIFLAPSQGMYVGQGISQGINQAMQNFANMRMRRAQVDAQKMHYQAMLESSRANAMYRAAMAESLGRRYGGSYQPDEVLKKYGLLPGTPGTGGSSPAGGPPVLPTQAMTTQSYADQKLNGTVPNIAAPAGSSAGLPTQVKGPAGNGMPSRPQPSQSPAVGNQPQVSGGQAPSIPGYHFVDYPTQRLLEKNIMAEGMAQRGVPGAEASKYAADSRLQGVLSQGQMRIQQAQNHDEVLKAINQMHDEVKKLQVNASVQNTNTRAGATTKAATIRAGATTDAASIRTNSPGGRGGMTASDKAGLQQLNAIDKQIFEQQKILGSPTHGLEGITMAPEQVQARVNGAKATMEALQASKERIFQAYPSLRPQPGAQPSPSQPQAGPAMPSAPAGQPAGSSAPAQQPGSAPGASAGMMSPLRIYEANEAHQAPVGALLRGANGTLFQVKQQNPNGDPIVVPAQANSPTPPAGVTPPQVPVGTSPQAPLAPPPQAPGGTLNIMTNPYGQ